MRITEPSNNDYDNDVSDNFDHNFGTFDDFGVKHCQRHNGPRILSPKLELSLKAETNANSNLVL